MLSLGLGYIVLNAIFIHFFRHKEYVLFHYLYNWLFY